MTSSLHRITNMIAKYSLLNQSFEIKFRPNEIIDVVSDAITFCGNPHYEHSPNGSTVSFTYSEWIKFVNYLRDALKDELFDDEEKKKIRRTLEHAMKQWSGTGSKENLKYL